MQALTKNKGLLIAIILFVLVMAGYHFFGGTDEEEILVGAEITAPNPGAEVLNLYGRLQTVTLDQSLFKTPAYKSLVDFSIEVPAQPISRDNPFAPLGR